MTAIILDGKKVAEKIRQGLKEQIKELGLKPRLAVVLVGSNPASLAYVGAKEKAAMEIGIEVVKKHLPGDSSEQDVLSVVEEMNNEPSISGMIVQLPLPAHIDGDRVTQSILPEKDVDGFSLVHLAELLLGHERHVACTPKGIIRLLEEYKVAFEGKHAVVVGRSAIVGKPAAALLLNRNCTVTVCHSRTRNLAEHTRRADILVAAVGKAGMVTAGMVKPGAVVVDVGTSRDGQKLAGDVDFEKVKEVASFITPVPGGIGPMTVAMLMENTVELAKNG